MKYPLLAEKERQSAQGKRRRGGKRTRRKGRRFKKKLLGRKELAEEEPGKRQGRESG